MTSIKMPQLGETIVEGTILKWLKQEGERVQLDEPLFEISTDKVDTEVPSSAAGVVAKILVPEGATVPVGTELLVIDEGAGAGEGVSGAGGGAAAGGAPPDAEVASQSYPSAETEAPTAPPEPGSPPGPSVPAVARVEPLPERGERSQILSPLVRKLAAEHGVDLTQIAGTGTGGRITKNDVVDFVAGRGGPPAPPAAAPALAAAPAEPGPPAPLEAPPPAPAALPAQAAAPAPVPERAGEEIIPVTHIRRAIADHMKHSLEVSARAWNAVEVNMENIARLRERAKETFREREGFGLTYTPFVARAATDALLDFPMVNSELREDQIVVRHFVNMGIAVSYDEGLIVPVVKGAETMNLVGMARAITDLATRARAKRLEPDEVHGGTFTITNPGPFGSLISVPIINQPQTAILAFDTVEKRPVVIEDAIAIRRMVYISMSWDHRVIDGALASRFLARVKANLETTDFAEDLAV